MKIKLLTLTAILTGFLAIGSADAATCEGGSLATGENGHEYCQSNSKMNWWSAYTWCQAQGRHLATMYEMCPDWDGSTGSKCANRNGSFNDVSWTSTAFQGNKAFQTYSFSSVDVVDRTISCRAICY